MSDRNFGLFVALAVTILVVLMSTPLTSGVLSAMLGRGANEHARAVTLSFAQR